jgi:CRP-like cAMP-binding protein
MTSITTSLLRHRRRRHHHHHHHKAEWLGRIPLFAACTSAELALIARNVDELQVEAGRVLIREGEVGREFLVIVDGTAAVRIDGRLVARLGPGDFVGEMALLERRCRTATVVAETPVRMMISGPGQFAELLVSAPNMTRKLLVGLAARLRTADQLATASAVGHRPHEIRSM